jgi:hypothetical protein
MKAILILRGLAGAGIVVALAYVLLRDERPGRRAAPATAPATAATTAPVSRADSTWPLDLPDRAHVDILDVYPAARAAALQVQPGVELFGISGTGLVHGTLDLAEARAPDAGPGAPLFFQFEDGGASRGRNKVRHHVDVKVDRDGLHVTSVEGAVLSGEHEGQSLETLAEPSCSSRKAWAAAVESGVPEDARATFLLRGTPLLLVWSIHVPGNLSYHRTVDARTCAIVDPPSPLPL